MARPATMASGRKTDSWACARRLATGPALARGLPSPAVSIRSPTPPTPAKTRRARGSGAQGQYALSVVDQFYQDITDHNYSSAWSLGGDNLSGGVGYDAWVAGYATTVSITLYDTANFGSGEVTAYLNALQSNGSATTYYVTNGVITSSSIAQTS